MANQGTEPGCKTSISEKESIKEHFAKPGLEQCIGTLCAFFQSMVSALLASESLANLWEMSLGSKPDEEYQKEGEL